jgi:hypothetical protein
VIREEKPLFASERDLDVIVLGLESFTQSPGDLSFVLYDEHSHGGQCYRGTMSAAPDKNVRNSSVANQYAPAMINTTTSHHERRVLPRTKEGYTMRLIMMLALVVCCGIARLASPVAAEPGAAPDREALARELRGAWLPLESGITLSRSEGRQHGA